MAQPRFFSMPGALLAIIAPQNNDNALFGVSAGAGMA
jgi:hypothetical protein